MLFCLLYATLPLREILREVRNTQRNLTNSPKFPHSDLFRITCWIALSLCSLYSVHCFTKYLFGNRNMEFWFANHLKICNSRQFNQTDKIFFLNSMKIFPGPSHERWLKSFKVECFLKSYCINVALSTPTSFRYCVQHNTVKVLS